MQPTYSFIIPTLNEAEAVRRLLTQIKLVPRTDIELIVSDGGSEDNTLAVARSFGAHTILGRRGRGFQLNQGAALAHGRILIFIHADSTLPDAFDQVLDQHFTAAGLDAAAFPIRFDPPHPKLRFASWWSRFDTILTRYGDQGLVVTREAFDSARGYPDWPLMEDVEICRRLREFTGIPALPAQLTTSSRRFTTRGVWRQRMANASTMLRFLLGASPWTLAARYEARRPRPSLDGLILFARNPVPGRVKTRLAATLGPERAAELYRAMAESALREALAASGRLRTYVFVADPADTEAVRAWLGFDLPVLGQASGDLGTRMSDAFETVFSYGHRKVLIAGTDVPGLRQSHLRRALDALDHHDLAFGPAEDGGYYLLGQKRHSSRLFEDMEWSQPTVLEQSLERARGLRLTTALLDTLEDVDDEASLRRSGWNPAPGPA